MSWKLLDSQTVLLDSWVALLDLNVHLIRRLADVGSVPASSNALREGYLCVSGNMCGIIMQHLAPSHWDSVSSGATPRRLTEKGKPLRKRNLKVD